MKRFLIPLGLFLLSWTLAAQDGALIKDVTGKVELQERGGAWKAAEAGMRISQGTLISTGFKSFATVEAGKAVIQMKPLTRMTLAELVRQEGSQNTTLDLRVGRVSAKVEKTEGLEHNFTLKSPVSTAAVRGTEFEFDSLRLKVIEGLVSYSNALGQGRFVAGGEESSISGNAPPKDGEQALIASSSTSISTSPIAAPAQEGRRSMPVFGGTITVLIQ